MQDIARGIVTEDSAATLLDRIENSAGVAYVADDITSIVVKSFDLSTVPPLLVKTTNLNPSTAIVALTTSGGWTEDDIGYNARLSLTGDHWPKGGRTYRIETTYTPVTGAPFVSLAELQADELFGS